MSIMNYGVGEGFGIYESHEENEKSERVLNQKVSITTTERERL